MPTDPTPTPREVLADTLLSLDYEYGTVFAKPKAEYLRQADACLAALAATGDAPLSAERLAEIERLVTEHYLGLEIGAVVDELLTAYTTLAAQLAAVRAERDALRGQVDEWDGVREHVRFLADATEANSVVEAYERDGVDFKDIDGHLQRDKEVVAAVRAVLARTGSPTPARPTDATPTEEG